MTNYSLWGIEPLHRGHIYVGGIVIQPFPEKNKCRNFWNLFLFRPRVMQTPRSFKPRNCNALQNCFLGASLHFMLSRTMLTMFIWVCWSLLRYYHQSDKFHNLLGLITNAIIRCAQRIIGDDILSNPAQVGRFQLELTWFYYGNPVLYKPDVGLKSLPKQIYKGFLSSLVFN